MVNCKNCSSAIQEFDKLYKCKKCGLTIWKTVYGHELTTDELKQLLEKGETGLITFISRERKPYKARLVLKNSRVSIEYNNSSVRKKLQNATTNANDIGSDTIKIRVESLQPGFSSLTISYVDFNYYINISFGLTSTREAECLSLIAAADYIKFYLSDYKEKNLYIEVNSQELAYYLLKETKPRDKQMQYVVLYTWGKLAGFTSYDIVYRPRKRAKLAGTNISRYYPKGLFPGLEKIIHKDTEKVFVFLPDNLAVLKQFTASFPKAISNKVDKEDKEDYKVYTLPAGLIPKIENWFNIVTFLKADNDKKVHSGPLFSPES